MWRTVIAVHEACGGSPDGERGHETVLARGRRRVMLVELVGQVGHTRALAVSHEALCCERGPRALSS